MEEVSKKITARIKARGIVQGVGFRPFIFQLAAAWHLTGWVCNTSENVLIEVEGRPEDINAFIAEIKTSAPPLARIEALEIETDSASKGYTVFEIRPSIAQADSYQPVSPDIATCPDCKKEIFDRSDKRYRYAFTNCTN